MSENNNPLGEKNQTQSQNDAMYSPNITKAGTRRQLGKRITLVVILVLIFSSIGVASYAGFFYNKTMKAANSVFVAKNSASATNNFDIGNLFNQVINRDTRTPLEGESEGRTNYLLIGKDYEENTDTLILLSYYYKEKQIVTMNIPRDTRVFDGYETSKVNAVWVNAKNRYEAKDTDVNPEQYLTNFMSNELGVPIPYYVRVNIEGVSKLIDELGGVDVTVDDAFTDCEYPTDNYAPVYYKSLGQSLPYIRPCPHFDPGLKTMDSRTALIYSRSRHSYDNPSEAIDFARSKRQSKVIEATLNKLKSKLSDGSFVLDINHINNLFEILGTNVQTSTSIDNALSFLKLIKQSPPSNQIQRFSLDFQSGIICNMEGTSDISLCDGAILGQKKSSVVRERLRTIVRNLLDQTQLTALFESKVVILGNGSDVIPKVQEQLINNGFKSENVTVNSYFKEIKAATLNSKERAYVYIPDPVIRDLFNKLKLNNNTAVSAGIATGSSIDYQVIDTAQSKYTLTKNISDAPIIIEIESVS